MSVDMNRYNAYACPPAVRHVHQSAKLQRSNSPLGRERSLHRQVLSMITRARLTCERRFPRAAATARLVNGPHRGAVVCASWSTNR